jgi:hypothetical protein
MTGRWLAVTPQPRVARRRGLVFRGCRVAVNNQRCSVLVGVQTVGRDGPIPGRSR